MTRVKTAFKTNFAVMVALCGSSRPGGGPRRRPSLLFVQIRTDLAGRKIISATIHYDIKNDIIQFY